MDEAIKARMGELNSLYLAAQIAGLCKNKKEFSQFVGIAYANLVSAMNGNPVNCNDNLVKTVKIALEKRGLCVDQKQTTAPEPRQKCQDADIDLALIHNDLQSLTAAVNRLCDIFEGR